jgi:two-component system chemotaxis response regulator CheB
MDQHASHRTAVVVGASAGGVEALRGFVQALPPDFPAAILVVLHIPAAGTSALTSILRRAGSLPVRQAAEGDKLTSGEILVAPPDRHLIVYDGAVTLSNGPRENGHRPAVDVLFRSAARALGPRVVGVVLSGALDDGAAGMVAITSRGGAGVVQDFDEALYDSMPRAAATSAGLDVTAPVSKIPDVLRDLLATEVPDAGGASDLMRTETAMADMDAREMHEDERPGTPSGFACPDCHGALFQIEEKGLVRYRCRVGHAWSSESLSARQANDLEGALWMALRSLEEKAALSGELQLRAEESRHDLSALRFAEHRAEAQSAAELVRELIVRIGEGSGPGLPTS